MNTSAPATAPVGLVELPSLAQLLAQAGAHVVTGPDYRSAATAIREAVGTYGACPIFVAETGWPGFRAWTEKTAKETGSVVVIRTESGSNTPVDGVVADISLPATVGTVLAAAGIGAPPALAETWIDSHGNISPIQAAPAPAAPAPVAPQPIFAAEPAPSFEPVPAAPVAPAPVAVDPWEAQQATQAPAAPAYAEPAFTAPPVAEPVFVPEPTPSFESVPAAPVAPAPVAVDPWEAQQAQQVAPAPAAPAYAEPAFTAPPVAEPIAQPVFEAPAAPAFAPQPVFEAPVAEPVFEAPAPVAPQHAFEAPVAPQPVFAPESAFTAPPVAEPSAQPVFEAPAPVAPTAPAFNPDDFAPPAPAAPAPAFTVPTVSAPVAEPVQAFTAPTQQVAPAPVAPPVAAPQHAAPATQVLTPRPRQQGLADVIVSFAGKGGVGKTTTAFSLAQRAANAGLRVVLVDANFGQGDMRTFLRIGSAGLPSIYQAAIADGGPDLKQALIDPDTLNKSRSPKLDPLSFAVVQAPPAHLTNPEIVTPFVYLSVIEQARDIADLVVVDTQIIESVDQTGMVDHLVLPLLRAGAWGVGITDLSSPGISNLLTRVKVFASQGVGRDQILTMMNRIPVSVAFNSDGVASAFNENSTFLGTVFADDSIPENMNRGRAVSNQNVLAPILDAALTRVTGRTDFGPVDPGHAPAESGSTKGGLFSRLRKGA